jgi:hypothetical protein
MSKQNSPPLMQANPKAASLGHYFIYYSLQTYQSHLKHQQPLQTTAVKATDNDPAIASNKLNYKPDDVGFNPSTQRHCRRLIYYLYIHSYMFRSYDQHPHRLISHAQQDANTPD